MSTCIWCKEDVTDCACKLDPCTWEERQRLQAGIAALADQTPDEVERIQIEALRRVTTPDVRDEDFLPPSLTRWHRDIDARRMQEGI